MARISRIRFVNIEYSQNFIDDLVLNCFGENTVIYLENGGGKSSLIGLIYSLLRPYSYDFLGRPIRSLSDYVLQKLPAHIIIEWILDDDRRTEFLLTGVIIEKRQDNSLNQVFYSLKYPQETSNHVTFDNFELTRDDKFLSQSKIISQLRSKKKELPGQDIKIINNEIGKWVEHLNNNLIDSDLIKVQLNMNKKEGGMESILDFQNDYDFIRFLIRNLTSIREKDQDLKEIRDVYDNIKELPKLEAQKEFITQLNETLEQGKPLEKEMKNLEKEVVKSIHNWENIKQFIDNSLGKVDIDLQNISTRLEDSKKTKNELELNLKESSEKQGFLRHAKNSLLLSQVATNVFKKSEQCKLLQQEKNYLEILPDYQMYMEKILLYKQNNERLLAQSKPIKEELEKNRQFTFYYCNKVKKKEEKELKKQNEELEKFKTKLKQVNQNIGGFKKEIENYKRDIENFTQNITIINGEEQNITDFLYEGKDLNESLDHYNQEKDKIQDSIALEEELLHKIDDEIEEKREIQKRKLEEYSNIQIRGKFLEEKLRVRLSSWKELASYPNFILFFGNEWNAQPPNYEILNQENLSQIEKEISILYQKTFKIAPKYTELEEKIKQFNETGQLPYNKNTQILIDFLKENNQDFWIGTGWEYLNSNFREHEKIKDISGKIPHLLEGIVVSLTNLDDIEKILEENKDIEDFKSLTEGVFISTPEIFKKHHLEKNRNNSIIFCPDFKFRFDDQELNSLVDKYKEILKNYANAIKMNNKQSSLHMELTEKWKNFLKNYSNTEYVDFIEELVKNQKLLEILIENNESIDLDIRKMRLKKISLIKEIKEKRSTSAKFQDALNQLNHFRYQYEKRIELNEQIKRKQSATEQSRLKLLELENILSELLSKEKTTSTIIKDIEDKLEDFNIKLRDLKHSFIQQIIIPKTEIEKFIEDISFDVCWKLFLDTKAHYDQILNESELKQIILNLEKHVIQLKSKIDVFCKNQKISVENPEFLKLYNENLSYEQILNEKKFVESNASKLKAQISELEKQQQNLKKENISLLREFNIETSNLQDYYNDIIQKANLIIEELEELRNEINVLKEELSHIINLNENLGESLKELNQNKKNLNTLKILTDSNLIKIVELKSSEELTIQEVNEIESESLRDLNNIIQVEQENFEELWNRKKNLDKIIDEFIIKVKKLNEKDIRNLDDIRLKDFIHDFNSHHISVLSSYISKMNKRLEQINECIKAPKARLTNIVKIYSTIIDDIITKIINLQKVKIPIPELSHMNNRQIIKIPISARDEVTGTVETYFKEIFENNSKFPADLTKSEIINTIIINYLQIRMRTIKFLFPEKSQTTAYEPITKLIKSSGGEKLTVAVMLYCLIAHYRMKYLGIRTPNISYPLIMDDPIGTASRADLIKMQVSLANHLKIQLIAFTHVSEVEALHQYYNFITLKRSVSKKSTIQVEVESEEGPLILIGGFVKLKPKMAPYFKKLDIYLGEQDQ